VEQNDGGHGRNSDSVIYHERLLISTSVICLELIVITATNENGIFLRIIGLKIDFFEQI
jgi:hypothetical protein